jgi:hypothetical protein
VNTSLLKHKSDDKQNLRDEKERKNNGLIIYKHYKNDQYVVTEGG